MRQKSNRRSGAMAVEFAFVLPLLFTLLVGTWEVGRVIQVEQVLANAAREGARVAAQGQTINLTGAYTQIQVNSGTPNVRDSALNYIAGCGFDTSGVNVTFRYLDGDTSKTEPWEGTKNQKFEVHVTMPYSNVRITNLNLLTFTTLEAKAQWVSLADDPFNVNTTVPTWNPIP